MLGAVNQAFVLQSRDRFPSKSVRQRAIALFVAEEGRCDRLTRQNSGQRCITAQTAKNLGYRISA
ncbi:MAG: hypothetical protein M3O33_04555, partial [Cyanobacteriota bacterium]|nr:hypothetical protein [Cyanobacteriota bacterium]